MRVFIAVDVNEPQITSLITKAQAELVATHSSVLKPVAAENLHITLKFLGEIDEDVVKVVLEKMKEIKFPPFKIKLRGIGYFPGGGRINVIWVGVTEGSDQLRGLHALVEDELSSLGFRRDTFSPHLTICRVKSVRDKGSLLKALSTYSDYVVGEQWVDALKVKKSTLSSAGPIYVDLLVQKL